MVKYVPLTVMLLCAVFSATAQNAPAEKFIKAFSETKNRWLVENNTDSIRNLLDSRCLYMHSNGWIQTADEVVKDMQSKKLVYKKISITESQARQYESMVIVTGKGRFEGEVDGKPFGMLLMYTEVYVKRKSNWKLVSRQSTKLE
jgi:predicted RNA-binding protein with PUA domain